MIDLFGMGRQEASPSETADEEAPAPDAPATTPKGAHGLWLVLLVVDSIFVIVFGGVVAAKIYEHWRSPVAAVPAEAPRHRPAPKPPEAAKPAPPAPPAPVAAAAVRPPEPPKPPEKPAAEKKAPHRFDAPRPPKPSLLTQTPRHAAPSLATTPGSKPASAAPAPTPNAGAEAALAQKGAAGKAMPVVFKLHAPEARSVQLIGAFIVHGGRKEMTKGNSGSWTVKLYLNPGQYRYFFAVDHKKTLDPENPQSDRGASLLTVP